MLLEARIESELWSFSLMYIHQFMKRSAHRKDNKNLHFLLSELFVEAVNSPPSG